VARGDDIHQAAMHGDMPALRHFLRVAPERVHEKFSSDGRRPQKNAVELRVSWWCCGLKVEKVPEEFLKILKFGAKRNFDFSILGVFWGVELPGHY